MPQTSLYSAWWLAFGLLLFVTGVCFIVGVVMSLKGSKRRIEGFIGMPFRSFQLLMPSDKFPKGGLDFFGDFYTGRTDSATNCRHVFADTDAIKVKVSWHPDLFKRPIISATLQNGLDKYFSPAKELTIVVPTTQEAIAWRNLIDSVSRMTPLPEDA